MYRLHLFSHDPFFHFWSRSIRTFLIRAHSHLFDYDHLLPSDYDPFTSFRSRPIHTLSVTTHLYSFGYENFTHFRSRAIRILLFKTHFILSVTISYSHSLITICSHPFNHNPSPPLQHTHHFDHNTFASLRSGHVCSSWITSCSYLSSYDILVPLISKHISTNLLTTCLTNTNDLFLI